MLERLNPPRVTPGHVASVAVSFDRDLARHAARYDLPLPPALAAAVPRRQAEFLAGRYCAREALRALGVAAAGMLGVRPDRAPAWPAGVVGSITHTDGFAWAAVAGADVCGGIGIDSETIVTDATAREIRPVVCTAADDRVLQEEVAPRWGAAAAVCLALSVRESFYKSLAGCEAIRPEPGDLHLVSIRAGEGRFRLRLTRALSDAFPAGHEIEGRFALDPPLVHTAVEPIGSNSTAPQLTMPVITDSLPRD